MIIKLHLKLTLLLSMIVAGPVVWAQNPEHYKGAITFGLTHGFNYATMNGDFPNNSYLNRVETKDISGRITPDIGINVDYHFNRKVSVQFDAIFSSMGCVVETYTTLYNEVAKIEGYTSKALVLDYIKFPLAVNFYPRETFYLNAGGYVSTLISSRERSYWYDTSTEEEFNFNDVDAGIIAGLGLNLSYVKLGFQYSYGLINVVKNEENVDLRNGVYSFVVRWKFYSEIRNPR